MSIVRAMTFNAYGPQLEESIEHIILTITAARADIIGLQEVETEDFPRIISLLEQETGKKWYYDARASIVSRWPLFYGGGLWVYTMIPEAITLHSASGVSPSQTRTPVLEKKLFLTSVHLPSRLYGPERLDRGLSPEKVLADEILVRLPALNVRLDTVRNSRDPCILFGDLNAPSHLDDVRIEWPVSKVLESANFQDSYRLVHPVPKQIASDATWWATRDTDKCTRKMPCTRREASARIDFVMVRNISVIDAAIVGEIGDIIVRPWHSDHRAIISTLIV